MKAPHIVGGDAAAILIDADNLGAAAIDQAFALLEQQGRRIALRRAYGGHEKLAGMKECLLRHGVRALVNHGKGTTDALLVVDAMDLLHASQLPSVVAIASSDADFAPLAVRLREAGVWVICFAQSAKSADGDLSRCYDQLLYVDGEAAAVEPVPPRTPRKAPARKRTKAAPPEPPADPVREVLESVEGFLQGRAIELNEVVKRLRDLKLMSKSASGPAFLKKNAPYAELTPVHQPNKLRLKEDSA